MELELDLNAYSVLVVDDDRDVLNAFRLSFGNEFRLICCSETEEALRIIATTSDLAVLLVDQRMPRMTGSQLLAEARRTRPEVVRMLITAYSDINAVIAAVNDGEISRYLVKPWNHDQVRLALREAIEVAHLRKQLRQLQLSLLEGAQQSAVKFVIDRLAHEVRNALTVARTSVQAVEMYLGHIAREVEALSPPASLRARFADAREAAGNAQLGLAQIYAVLVSEQRPPEPGSDGEVVDVKRLMELTLKLLPPELLGRATVRLRIDVQRTRSDATALGQILLNLLINACHALPPERAAGNIIELGATVIHDKLVLRVSDNGHGIPKDQLAHIFEPRFTTKGGAGAGLGLAISQDLAGQLGGSLTCRSVPGQGTTFELHLPYHPVP